MSDPHDPRPSHKVQVRAAGQLHGLDVELLLEVDVRKLSASIQYLLEQGLEPTPRPLSFDLTPDGKPICPKHKAPMAEREKQGDRWYSHRVLAADGSEHWCRGYAGPESPGFLVPAAHLIPAGQPKGTVGHPYGARTIPDYIPPRPEPEPEMEPEPDPMPTAKPTRKPTPSAPSRTSPPSKPPKRHPFGNGL